MRSTSAGIAIRSRVCVICSRICSLVGAWREGGVDGAGRGPAETVVTLSESPASWRRPSQTARTANFVPA